VICFREIEDEDVRKVIKQETLLLTFEREREREREVLMSLV
jgi:hypothetical protein